MKTLKKIHLKSVSDFLSDNEMKQVVGGYPGDITCYILYRYDPETGRAVSETFSPWLAEDGFMSNCADFWNACGWEVRISTVVETEMINPYEKPVNSKLA